MHAGDIPDQDHDPLVTHVAIPDHVQGRFPPEGVAAGEVLEAVMEVAGVVLDLLADETKGNLNLFLEPLMIWPRKILKAHAIKALFIMFKHFGIFV